MRCIDAEGEMNGKYQYYRMQAAEGRKEGKRDNIRVNNADHKSFPTKKKRGETNPKHSTHTNQVS